jgi:hypothetical protein
MGAGGSASIDTMHWSADNARAEPEAAMPRVKDVPEEADEFRFKEPGEDPEYDTWFREQVQIGIDEADRGELIPHETIRREWRKMRAELLRRVKEEK